MSAQHTPGPWDAHTGFAEAVEDGQPSIHGGGTSIALVRRKAGIPLDVSLANARLIAAAPELLAALEALVGSFEKHRPKEYWDAARAAIAKVRGEA